MYVCSLPLSTNPTTYIYSEQGGDLIREPGGGKGGGTVRTIGTQAVDNKFPRDEFYREDYIASLRQEIYIDT